jgi:hypothetical protein
MVLPTKPKIPNFFWAASGSIDGSNPHFPSASQPPTTWFNSGYNTNDQPSALWTNQIFRTISDWNRGAEKANDDIQFYLNNQQQFLSRSLLTTPSATTWVEPSQYGAFMLSNHLTVSEGSVTPFLFSSQGDLNVGGLVGSVRRSLAQPARQVRIPRQHVVGGALRSVAAPTPAINVTWGRISSSSILNLAGQNWSTNQVYRFNLDTQQTGFTSADEYSVMCTFQPSGINYYAFRAIVLNKDPKGFHVSVNDPVSGIPLALNNSTNYGTLSVMVISRKGN